MNRMEAIQPLYRETIAEIVKDGPEADCRKARQAGSRSRRFRKRRNGGRRLKAIGIDSDGGKMVCGVQAPDEGWRKRLRHGAGEPGPIVRDNPADGGRGFQSGILLQYPQQKERPRGGRRPCRPAPSHPNPRPAQPMFSPKAGKPSGDAGCFRSYLQPPPRIKDRCRAVFPMRSPLTARSDAPHACPSIDNAGGA